MLCVNMHVGNIVFNQVKARDAVNSFIGCDEVRRFA